MSSNQEKINIHPMIRAIPLNIIITAYIIFCGFTYICGYWLEFKIDISLIISLMTPIDIIKSAMISFISYYGLMGVHLLFSFIEEYPKTNKKDDNWLLPKVILIPVTILVLTLIYYFFKLDSDKNYYDIAITATIATLAAVILSSFKIKKYFESDASRYTLMASSILAIPLGMFSYGHIASNHLFENKKVIIMTDNSSCTKDSHEKFALLAFYGDKAISLSLKNHTLCIFNSSTTNFITQPQVGNIIAQYKVHDYNK